MDKGLSCRSVRKALVPLLLFMAIDVAGACPPIAQDSDIVDQYQGLQHASSWLSITKERELQRLFAKNTAVLSNLSCYSLSSKNPQALGDILTVIKLQILKIRYATFKKDTASVARTLEDLRHLIIVQINESSTLSRRLGANIRSLYLDELERLMMDHPNLVAREMNASVWVSDFTPGMETEILTEWEKLRAELNGKRSPSALAKLLGRHSWKKHSSNKTSKMEKLLRNVGLEEEQTLESQLLALFQANSLNLELDSSQQVIKHYLALSVVEIRKNNYFVLKPWLEPVIEEKVRNLKSELGVSYGMIFPLLGVSIDGPFRELDQPIELFERDRIAQAKIHYARVKNPLGRLYEIIFLKRISEMWNAVDVAQLKIDLNRASFLKTLLAVSDYEKRFSKWPQSLNDLVQEKLIPTLPKDYFSGQGLRYDSRRRQIWSVGQNGLDEKGSGDDFSLRMSL